MRWSSLLLCSLSLLLFAPPAEATILSEMQKLVGVREKGHNRGELIDRVNKQAGVPLASPYCASTIYDCWLKSGGIAPKPQYPASALSWRDKNSVRATKVLSGEYRLQPDDLLIWQVGATGRGHIEVTEKVINRKQVQSIGANTTCGKDTGIESIRDGSDGICRKRRTINPYDYFGIKYISRPKYS